ncbi:MAG TPA: nucleotide exchange factor GrpE [Anaerolineaceae bacterium]|mgnify:FL=1|nr:nucleotide exchange factor GrpE [Chloroflexota bacterium]HNY84047.1 nucleotide exchange factor GrpE [Anaerolineaceae bacterium]
MKEPKRTNKTEKEEPQEDPVVAALQKELVETKQKADEYLDDLQRERASFANYKRRIDQENAEIYQKSLGDHIKPFLPVIDDLERSLKHRPEDQGARQWVEGVDLILKKLLNTLQNNGVQAIEAKPGDMFDPNFHEAITHEENEQYTDGQIIEVVQTGYKNNDRIIRPALVRVAK